MPTIEVNGTKVAFDDAGSGPPLLLLHAGIADRRMWSDVLAAFAQDFRTIAPDHRGFGDTPIPNSAFSWTADLVGLLEALQIERASLVGVSMSGHVAIDLALTHPERVDRMVLVGAGLAGWDHDDEMVAADEAEEAALEAGDLDAAAWGQVRFWQDGPERSAAEVEPRLRQRVFEMQRHAYAIDEPAAELTWLVPEYRHELTWLVPEYRPRLGEIDARTLVLAGSLDRSDIRRMAPVLAAEIPNARYRELPGVAHLPPMEDPVAFVDVVRGFLLEP